MTWREYTALLLMAFSVVAVIFAERVRRRRETADNELKLRQQAKDRRDREERKIAIYNLLREEGNGLTPVEVITRLRDRGLYLGTVEVQILLEDLVSDMMVVRLTVEQDIVGIYGKSLIHVYKVSAKVGG